MKCLLGDKMTLSLRKLLATTIIFFSVSSICMAASDEIFFCISPADESQKILTISNNQQGKIGSTIFDLNESNQVLVGPSKDGKIFLKLDAKKLELISASGVWKGKCHKVQGTDADAITSTTVKKPKTCVDMVGLCTKQELCAKGVRKVNGKKKWDTRSAYVRFSNAAKKKGLSCGINKNDTSSSSSSTKKKNVKRCKRNSNVNASAYLTQKAADSWFPKSITITIDEGKNLMNHNLFGSGKLKVSESANGKKRYTGRLTGDDVDGLEIDYSISLFPNGKLIAIHKTSYPTRVDYTCS